MNESFKSFAKEFFAKHNITSGLTQAQAYALGVSYIEDAMSFEATEAKRFREAIGNVHQINNTSAMRQAFEGLGMLEKTERSAKVKANEYLNPL